MASNRDDFNRDVIDSLAKRACYRCSNPDCRVPTLMPSGKDPNKYIYSGVAAHITAAARGGPRYDPLLSDSERAAITNGIHLCQSCSVKIDKNGGLDYPATLLHEWKRGHEQWVTKLGKTNIQQLETAFQNGLAHIAGGRRESVVDYFGRIPPWFCGRENEIAELWKHFANPQARFITITGLAGIGKTALLIDACLRLEVGAVPWLDQTPYVPLYIRTDQTTLTPEALLFHLERTDMLWSGADAHDEWCMPSLSLLERTRLLIKRLKGGAFWVVVDGLEKVLTDENEFEDKELRDCIELCVSLGIRFLATSRERVAFAGKARIGSSISPYIQSVNLHDGLPPVVAITVLKHMDTKGILSDCAEDLLLETVEKTGGIPLALLTVMGILDEDGITLARFMRDERLFRGRVLDNLIAEQCRRLPEDHLRVLEVLAIYNKPVEALDLEGVLNEFPAYATVDVAKSLIGLKRYNMVTYVPKVDTYALHSLHQEYLYSRISDSDDAIGRSLLHYGAAKWIGKKKRPSPADWKTPTDLDWPLDEVLHYRKAGLHEEAANVLLEMGRTLHDTSPGLFLKLIREATTITIEEIHILYLKADLLNLVGVLYGYAGEHRKAITYIHAAYRIGQKSQDALLIIRCYRNLGYNLHLSGRLGAALSCYEKALNVRNALNGLDAISEFAEILPSQEEILGEIGICYESWGCHRDAIRIYKEAQSLAEQSGNRQAKAIALLGLGNNYALLGESDLALELCKQAHDLFEQMKLLFLTTTSLHSIAQVLADKALYAEALASAERAVLAVEETGLSRLGSEIHSVVSRIYLETGRYVEARQATDRALGFQFLMNDPYVLVVQGLSLLQEDRAAALDAFHRAGSLASKLFVRSKRNYDALDMEWLATCGMAACNGKDLAGDIAEMYREARNIDDSPIVLVRLHRMVKVLLDAQNSFSRDIRGMLPVIADLERKVSQ